MAVSLGRMSRSKHQTIKSVFGGFSKPAIDQVAAESGDDLAGLLEKKVIKRAVKKSRRQQRAQKSD
jgi:hypothetical protein